MKHDQRTDLPIVSELLAYELLSCTSSTRPGAVIEQVVVWVVHSTGSFATKAHIGCLSQLVFQSWSSPSYSLFSCNSEVCS